MLEGYKDDSYWSDRYVVKMIDGDGEVDDVDAV
jgi:hypothetical protein